MIFITVYLPHFANALAIQIKLFHVQITLKGHLVYQLSAVIEISTYKFADSSFKQVPVVRAPCTVVPGIVAFHLVSFGVSLCLHLCR